MPNFAFSENVKRYFSSTFFYPSICVKLSMKFLSQRLKMVSKIASRHGSQVYIVRETFKPCFFDTYFPLIFGYVAIRCQLSKALGRARTIKIFIFTPSRSYENVKEKWVVIMHIINGKRLSLYDVSGTVKWIDADKYISLQWVSQKGPDQRYRFDFVVSKKWSWIFRVQLMSFKERFERGPVQSIPNPV